MNDTTPPDAGNTDNVGAEADAMVEYDHTVVTSVTDCDGETVYTYGDSVDEMDSNALI